MKKSIMSKLGLETSHRLNKRICMERVRYLNAGLEKGRYKGSLERYAKYYRSWYRWMGQNGGTRAKRAA